MASPAPAPSRSAVETPAAIELATRLLAARNEPAKVEAALVYQGYTKETARELVHGLLSGRIQQPPSESDERAPTDWATFPPTQVLALGLFVLTVTIFIAAKGRVRVIYLTGLVGGLLISCAGLQALMGPKHRRLSTALCLLLIVVATAAARFLRVPGETYP